MKQGFVTDGIVTGIVTTRYGNNAINWLAAKAVDSCETIEKARYMIGHSTGSYRATLIARLEGKYLRDAKGKQRKFKITKALEKKMAETDAAAAKREQKRFNHNRMYEMRTNKIRVNKRDSKTPCIGCGKTIKAGKEFYQCSHEYRTFRAHKGCADKSQLPK